MDILKKKQHKSKTIQNLLKNLKTIAKVLQTYDWMRKHQILNGNYASAYKVLYSHKA